MKSKNTIEFNGVHYDASTGSVVGSTTAHPAKRRNIDGFFRNPRQNGVNLAAQHQVAAVKTAPAPVTDEPMQEAVRKSVTSKTTVQNHVKHHTAQPSKTLMRAAVAKPTFGIKKHIAVQYDLPATTPSLVVTKTSAYSVSPSREERAKQTNRSPHVARHATAATAAHTSPVLQPLAVQPVPVKPEATDPSGVPAPVQSSKPVDIFEQAMANASHYIDVKSHRTHFRKRTKRHLATMGAGALALIIVGGFVAYTNSPSLQLKVASIRSGVGATNMPDFKAAGFKYSGAASKDGSLTFGFTDANGTYQLTKQPTNWDSEDLINNVGSIDASGFPTYTTLTSENTTVYRLSNNSATWIANGTWYQLNGTGALSDTQVAALVKQVQ